MFLDKYKTLKQDLVIVLLMISSITIASVLQFKYILGLELGLKTFIMPSVIALGFSILIIRMRTLQWRLNEQSSHLKEMNEEVRQLNQQLSQRLSDRTQLLEEVKEQLSNTQQRRAMSSLAEGVLQNLNTSLMVISSAWEEIVDLDRKSKDRQTKEELVEELSEAIQKALSYACQYQDFNRLTLQEQETPIVEVMDRMTPFLSRLFQNGQQFSIIWENKAPCRVKMPLARFVQVMINLVDNARDALNEQPGQVKIKFMLSNQSSRDCLQISIIDTGIGMSEEIKERSTEAFFSTKALGIGLGLHVSLGAVREAEGALMISSAVGSGTMIRIILPCLP